MNSALHHLSKRKRNTKKELESYPSPKKSYRFLDKLVLFVAVLSPAMSIPQIYTVFSNQSVANISFATWFSWTIFSVVWLLYGLVHKEKPIILTQSLWLIIHLTMVAAFFIY